MKEDSIRELLAQVAGGRMSPDEALVAMRHLPFEDLGFAKIDHHRTLRCGAPEVIFCAGKTPEHVARIAQSLLDAGSDLLASRATAEHFEAVQAIREDAEYHAMARCITVRQGEAEEVGCVVVVTGGTSDLPVAEEAAVTARMLGARTELISDVGVAGIHRLLAFREQLEKANVLVAVAGMEGALASVVGGLVAKPVIGVPTSVGYGSHFGGVTPLLSMLNSCASGVAVVNIDNGFGAGYIAALINSLAVAAGREE